MGEGSMLVGGAIARSCAQHQQGRGYKGQRCGKSEILPSAKLIMN
jgi:hypothetical protein